MKRVLTILLTTLFLAPAVPLYAQEYTQPPVTVSKEKIRDSDGKVYYTHVVLERQTLFSIAKAYGVSVDQIYEANAELDIRNQGLKKTSILRIPAIEVANEPLTAPDIVDKVTTHIVKWYENLEDIAQKYGVKAEEIIQANKLKSGKIKSRMALTIPKPGVISKIEEKIQAKNEEEVIEEPEATEEKSTVGQLFGNLIDRFSLKKNTVNVALVLPFNASGNPSNNNFDFYSGFLMGVRQLGEEGISTNLSVYDATGTTLPITSAKIEECDMVVGPVSGADLEKLLALNLSATPVISPLDHKAGRLTEGNRHFIQSPTPYEVQYDDIVNWIMSDSKRGDKVVVISEKGGQGASINAQLAALLEERGIAHTDYSYNILQGRDVNDAMAALMGPEVNRVVIASESEAFVNDVVRNLNQLVFRKHNIVLYSSSRIRTFNTIDVENFHSLNMHASLSYFIDYDSPEVREFLLEYRALYGTEPTQFSFQGYDIAKYFISSCAKDGNNWLEVLSSKDGESLLQNEFLFAEEDGGGFSNQGIRRIEYTKDFRIVNAD